MEGRTNKNEEKKENAIQNTKFKFKNTIFSKTKIPPVKWKVCENSTFPVSV
jgi:hypothetical protein